MQISFFIVCLLSVRSKWYDATACSSVRDINYDMSMEIQKAKSTKWINKYEQNLKRKLYVR